MSHSYQNSKEDQWGGGGREVGRTWGEGFWRLTITSEESGSIALPMTQSPDYGFQCGSVWKFRASKAIFPVLNEIVLGPLTHHYPVLMEKLVVIVTILYIPKQLI